MFKPRFLRNVVLSVLMAIVCISGSTYAADPTDELLNLTPAESILAVRINNFDLAAGQLDTYLTGLSPIPVSLSMLAKMQFGQILGNPMLTGINTAGNFGVYALAKPGQIEPVIVILIPVTNYAEFVSASPNVGVADTDGISQLMMNGHAFAAIKNAGNYVVIAEKKQQLKMSVDKGLGTAIDSVEKNIAATKPIWAYVNIQKVGETYGQIAVAQLEKSKTMMTDVTASLQTAIASLEEQKSQLDANDSTQADAIEKLDKQIASMKKSMKQFEKNPAMDNFASIMDMYIHVVETLLKESKSFSLAIEPKADVLTAQVTYTTMPGSDLAKVLIADTSQTKADKLMNYLQEDAMVNFACRLNKPLLRRFYNDSIGLMGVMTGEKMSDEEITKFKQMTTDIIDSLGGTAAVSFWADETASPPFMEDCIIEVSDAEKFNKSLVKAMELWNDDSGFMDFYKDMGMNLNYVTKMNIYDYKGAKVNSAKLTFESTDPNSQEGQIIKKMYGDGFEYRWAVVDGLCVEAIAGEVEVAIKKMIDEVKAGGATEAAAEIKQAVAMLGDGVDDFFGTFNIVRMMKMMAAVPDFPLQNITDESTSNIAFGGKIANGKAIFKVAVPKAHIIELMKVVKPKASAK